MIMKTKANDKQAIAFCKVLKNRFSRSGYNDAYFDYFEKWIRKYSVNEKQWNMINDTCKEIDKAYIENMNYKIV